jgi:hypothetical protein
LICIKDLLIVFALFGFAVNMGLASTEDASCLSRISRTPSLEEEEKIGDIFNKIKEIYQRSDGLLLESQKDRLFDEQKIFKFRLISADEFEKAKHDVLSHLFCETAHHKICWLNHIEQGNKFPGWSLYEGYFTVLLPENADFDMRRVPIFPARLRPRLLKGTYDLGDQLELGHLMSWACADNVQISLSDLVPSRGQTLLWVPTEYESFIPSVSSEAKGALTTRFLKGIFQENTSSYIPILLQEKFALDASARISVCDGLRTSHGAFNPSFMFTPHDFSHNKSAGLITNVEWQPSRHSPAVRVDLIGSSFFEEGFVHTFLFFRWLVQMIADEHLPISVRWLSGFWQKEVDLKRPSVYSLKLEALCGENPRTLTLEDTTKGAEARFMMLNLLKYTLGHETPHLIVSAHEGSSFLEVPQVIVKEQAPVSRHLRRAFWDKYDAVHVRQVDGHQLALIKKHKPHLRYQQTEGFLGTLIHALVGRTCEVIHVELPHRDVNAEDVYEHIPGVRGIFDALKRHVEKQSARVPHK